MNKASILIVIPCLNEAVRLPGLLSQLVNDNPANPIIVADGRSTDNSRQIIQDFASRHANVHLLDNPDRLQSAGINKAAIQFGADHDWLVRVDAHCLYPDNYAEKLVLAASVHGAKSVVVPMISKAETCFQKASAAAQNTVLGTGGSAHRHAGKGQFVDHGHHALMDLASFRQVGGYDERISHNEDAELDARLRKSGAAIWLEAALPLTYFPRSSPAALFRQYWNYGKGRAITRSLHGENLRLRQLLPLAVPLSSLLVPFCAVHWLAALPFLAWLLLTLVAGIFMTGNDPSPCARMAGVAAAIMHFAWGWGFIQQTVLIALRLKWRGKTVLEGPLPSPNEAVQ